MAFLFGLLFFLTPLVFFPQTSEVFEFNKIILIYGLTIVVIFLWALKALRQRKLIFRRTMLDVPLILFLTISFFSSLTSIDPRTSFLGYYSRFHGGFLSLLSYSLLYWAAVANLDSKEVKKIIRFALLAAGIVASWAILEHFGRSPSCLFITGKFDAECWVQDVVARPFATLGQPNWLAAYLTALSPLFWTGAFKRAKISVLFPLALLLFTAILFSQSRSGLLGFAAASGVFWVSTFQAAKKDFLKKFLILNFSFLVLVLVLGSPWTKGVYSSRVSQTASPALEGGGTESGEIRKIVWQGAVGIWQAYPLLGTGPETFAWAYYQFRPAEHNLVSEWDFLYNKAHNEYLNYLATSGALGLISYLFLIAASLKQMRKNPALLAGYTSLLISNFFGFSVTSTGLFFFLFPALAVSLNKASPVKNKNKPWRQREKFLVAITLIIASYFLFLVAKYWYADLLFARGKKEAQRGHILDSAQNLQKASRLFPKEPLYHNELAQTYASLALYFNQQENSQKETQQLRELALVETQIATTLSPRNVSFKKNQINTINELSALKTDLLLLTLPLFDDLQILAPTDAKVFYTLALTYEALGERQKAIETLLKTIELKDNYDKARLALARIYRNEGQEQLAREQLEYILENRLAADEEPIKQELEKFENDK